MKLFKIFWPIGLLVGIINTQLWGTQQAGSVVSKSFSKSYGASLTSQFESAQELGTIPFQQKRNFVGQASSLPLHHSRLEACSTEDIFTKQECSQEFCPAQLGTAIEAITERPEFRRLRWGILIQNLSTTQTLYGQDAQKYFIPASNLKLLTTAAALHRLGAKFRIRTSVYGTKNGLLRVVGRGDPSLTDIQLRELAKQLSQQGIHHVSQLAVEDKFPGDTLNPTWEWEDIQSDYGAPVSSLILNQNTVSLMLLPQSLGKPLKVLWSDPEAATQWRVENQTVTGEATAPKSVNVSLDLAGTTLRITGQLGVGSQPEPVALAILNPNQYFLQHFRRALATQKVTVSQVPVTSQSVDEAELAAVESPPLSELLVETNQNSNNLYAEALLRVLGRVSLGEKVQSPSELGLAAVKGTLTQLGVDPTGYLLADGSGLSRHNLVSPEALVQTLRAMAKSPEAAIYRTSLPTSGISGTLQNRFRNSIAQGILRAKTGSLTGVNALSGYINTPHYDPLVFSIIVNQSDQPAVTIRQAIDKVVLLLTRLHQC